MRMRLSIRSRVALLSALATLLLLIVVATSVYLLLGGSLVDEIETRLVTRSATLMDEMADNLDELDELAEELDEESSGPAQIVRVDGQVLASAGGLSPVDPAMTPAQLRDVDEGLQGVATASQGGERYRVLGRRFAGTDTLLLVAQDLDTVTAAQPALLRTMLPITAVAAVLTGIAAALVAGRGLRPLTTMAASARTVNAGALDQRLPVPSSNDEVTVLARTINAMLDRLAGAIERERSFTADASHELRTPLAILRGEIELVRAKTDGAAAKRLDSALEEADRLAGLIEDILVIARTDASESMDRSVIDLGEMVTQVVKRFQVLAGQRDVDFGGAGQATVRGDPRGVDRAVANLVDNAVRHTPPGGRVRVTCQQIDSGARIVVADSGPGVEPALLGRLFERFSRTDDARTGGGAGLGLAIVAAVATSHDGSVVARNRQEGGLEVTLELGGRRPPAADVTGAGEWKPGAPTSVGSN